MFHLSQLILGSFNFTSKIFVSEYHSVAHIGLRNQVKVDMRHMLKSNLPVVLLNTLELMLKSSALAPMRSHLQKIVIGMPSAQSNPFSKRQDIREILVWDFIQPFRMIFGYNQCVTLCQRTWKRLAARQLCGFL
jgi:hypothetical protein